MAEKKAKEATQPQEAPQENAAPAAASPVPKEKPRKLDETRPGGYYIVEGRAVNAEGKRIEED